MAAKVVTPYGPVGPLVPLATLAQSAHHPAAGQGKKKAAPVGLGIGASVAVGPHVGGHWSPAQVSAYAQSRGAPKWLADALGATTVPESGGNPDAVNSSSHATGLTQVLPRAWPQLFAAGNEKDPRYNIDSALYILSVQGSGAWSGSGTWRGPPVRPGQFHFPKPSAASSAAGSVIGGSASGSVGTSGGVSVPNPLSGLDAIGSFFAALLDPHTWARIGKIAFGGLLLIFAVYEFASQSKIGAQVVSNVKGAATAAAIA